MSFSDFLPLQNKSGLPYTSFSAFYNLSFLYCFLLNSYRFLLPVFLVTVNPELLHFLYMLFPVSVLFCL